jgi:hypothetical protein
MDAGGRRLEPADRSAKNGTPWRRAFAVGLVLVLLYPAWLGLVEYPRARLRARRAAIEAHELHQTLDSLRLHQPDISTWSGAVPQLLLSNRKRSWSEQVPTLHVRPEQPLQPIVIDHDLLGTRADAIGRWMDVRIIRTADSTAVWQHREQAQDLWDAANQLVSLIVPTKPLQAGDYRLEIQEVGAPQPRFTALFRVVTR